MALTILSNFAANVAHRNLVMSDAAATSSLSKLSSGQRVLSARDDAASLAVGSRLRAEVAAMRTARVNAGQAGSMLQIGDGAMATISDILVRMKELAVQASSGQFSSLERGILDSEFQALSSEITRISNDTEFNGTQLIAGAGDTVTEQEGTTGGLAALGFAITFDSNVTTSGDAYRLTYDSAGGENLSLINLNTGDQVTVDVTAAIDAVLAARATPGTAGVDNLVAGESVAIQFTSLGITVTLDDSFVRGTDIDTSGTTVLTLGGLTADAITVANDSDGGVTNAALTALLASTDFDATTGLLTINIINSAVDVAFLQSNNIDFGAGVSVNSADVDNDDASNVLINIVVGGETIGQITLDGVNADGAADGTFTVDLGNLLFGQSTTTGGSNTSFSFKVGTGNQSYDSLTFTVNAASASALGVLGTDQGGLIGITTANLAETASTAVSAAIDTLNQSRSDVGAAQNRLTFAANNLAISIENAEAARSSMLDLDVAAEITVFTSKQILIQTGVSMLAQANQLPQNLLRLFQ